MTNDLIEVLIKICDEYKERGTGYHVLAREVRPALVELRDRRANDPDPDEIRQIDAELTRLTEEGVLKGGARLAIRKLISFYAMRSDEP